MLEIAIIGAGLAGLTAARELQRKGFHLEVFDKSRGLGGRLATRRNGEIRLDHGLPSWQILGKHTEALTAELKAANCLQPWQVAETSSADPAVWQGIQPTATHDIAPDGMTAIAKYLAQDITVHRNHLLTSVQPIEDHWELTFENATTITAKLVILAIPFPQSLPLIQPWLKGGDRLNRIQYDPILSLMLGYDQALPEFPWQELRLPEHPLFKAIIRDGQKRSPQANTLVIQSSATFATTHLEASSLEPASQILIEEISKSLQLPAPSWQQIHRWRYGFPQQVLGETHRLANVSLPLFLCGDWCLGNGIEGAIASGIAVSQVINVC